MSAYDFKDYEERYQGLNECPKLSKPFEMRELVSVLDNLFVQDTYMEA